MASVACSYKDASSRVTCLLIQGHDGVTCLLLQGHDGVPCLPQSRSRPVGHRDDNLTTYGSV